MCMCVLCECVCVCAYVMACMYVVVKGQSKATVLKPSTLFEIRSSFSAHCCIHQDSWPTASGSFQYRIESLELQIGSPHLVFTWALGIQTWVLLLYHRTTSRAPK